MEQNLLVYATREIKLLKWLTILLFVGRAWEHLIWDPPFRTLFWDPNWMGWFAEGVMGVDWDTFTTSTAMDQNLMVPVRVIGVIYLLLAGWAFWLRPQRNRGAGILLLGSILLSFLAFLHCKEHFWRIGELLELTLQIGTPAIFWWALRHPRFSRTHLNFVKVLIALTFLGHGLYASGFYPIPGYFTDMVINGFGLSEVAAKNLLLVVGLLDFSLLFALFLPRISRYFLYYALIWGLMTAIARVASNFQPDFFLGSTNRWLWEVMVRLPHAGIPLLLIWWKMRWPKKEMLPGISIPGSIE